LLNSNLNLEYIIRLFTFLCKHAFCFIQESQTRSTELENERQRIQTEFENYYQRTHHLEELQQQQQQKSLIANNSDQINQVFSILSSI
jgi:hypothetical protein